MGNFLFKHLNDVFIVNLAKYFNVDDHLSLTKRHQKSAELHFDLF